MTDAAKTLVIELSKRALAICDNPGLTKTAKLAQLAPIEAQLAEAQNELSFTRQKKSFQQNLGVHFGDLGASGENSVGYNNEIGARGQLGNAPVLSLPRDEAQCLFKAATTGLNYVTKAMTTAEIEPALVPGQVQRVVDPAWEGTRILDLVPSSPTDRASMDFYEVTGTSSAAPVAEGAQKPESKRELKKKNVGATKIAHWSEVTEEALEDYAPFEKFLAADMAAGVIDAENRELLYGTGTGASKFKGLLKVSGIQAYARVGTDTILDALEIGGSQLRSSGRLIDPTGYIMHPLDYSRARRTKSTTGEYIAGDPTQDGPKKLWGYPVIVTTQITQGTAVVANLLQATQAWIRQPVNYRTSITGAGFRSNKVELLGEERIIFAVPEPGAVCVVDLADPAPGE